MQPNTEPFLFPADAFRRYDETPDADFYAIPRLVTHIDEAAINAVTALYREFFPTDGAILDLMSSWISHLPSHVPYHRVVGLGMNGRELAANPRLDEWVVQDLNTDTQLPFADGVFDGCGLCVSIDYLTNPVAVLQEAGRVLTPDAPLVITFSNRCFPTKAVAIWHSINDLQRMDFVALLLEQAGEWTTVEKRDCKPEGDGDPLFAVIARRK